MKMCLQRKMNIYSHIMNFNIIGGLVVLPQDVVFNGDSHLWESLSTGSKKEHQYYSNKIEIDDDLQQVIISKFTNKFVYDFAECAPVFLNISNALYDEDVCYDEESHSECYSESDDESIGSGCSVYSD